MLKPLSWNSRQAAFLQLGDPRRLAWSAPHTNPPVSTCPVLSVFSQQSLNCSTVTHLGWLIYCSPNSTRDDEQDALPARQEGRRTPPLSPSASCLNTKPWALPRGQGPAAGRHQELVRDYGVSDPSCNLFLPRAYSPSIQKSPQRSAWSGSSFQSLSADLLSQQDLPGEILSHLLGVLQLPPLRSIRVRRQKDSGPSATSALEGKLRGSNSRTEVQGSWPVCPWQMSTAGES